MAIGTCICKKKQWLQHQMLIILQKISCNTINELLIAWGVILKGNILWANWLLYNPLMAIIDKVVSIIQYQSLHFSFHLCSKGYLGVNRRHLFKNVSILEGIFRRGFYSTGALLLEVFSGTDFYIHVQKKCFFCIIIFVFFITKWLVLRKNTFYNSF